MYADSVRQTVNTKIMME